MLQRSKQWVVKAMVCILLAMVIFQATIYQILDLRQASVVADEIPPTQEATKDASDWSTYYTSQQCLQLRNARPGTKAEGTMGKGQRTKCFDSESSTVEYRTEIDPSFDISITHKVIYFPVMKAGTQMFQEVFRRRLQGRRIQTTKALQEYIAKHNMQASDFFSFSFVREPFRMFVSAYEEANKYVMNNRSRVRGFADLPLQQEPERSIVALDNVRQGYFNGLIPAHVYPQTWKLQRCGLNLSFVGKLENINEDWRYIETKLGIEHAPLPVIHASAKQKRASADEVLIKSKEILGRFEENSNFDALTRQVCDYYEADFLCFGYSSTACNL